MNKKMHVYVLLVALVFMLAGIVTAEPAKTTEETTTTTITAASADATTEAPLEDPIQLLQGISDNVLHALQQHKNKEDLNGVYALVNKYVLPYVDFNEMSVWIAGRTAWGKATEQNKEAFIDAFKVLVVRTYATALNSYTNEKVVFGKQKYDPNKQRIQITSTVVRGNNNDVHLVYRLIKKDNKWYMYDIIIEGVSILQGFQAQFSEEIRKSGLQTVTAQIQEHNRQKHA
jgi:phospholipid transport system substrate-binding protein